MHVFVPVADELRGASDTKNISLVESPLLVERTAKHTLEQNSSTQAH